MFSDQDVRTLAKVAVVGKTVTDQLFPDEDPIGQTFLIRNIPFKIVGLLAKGFNLLGQDQDDVVIIPYTSHMRRITSRTFVNSILVQAANRKNRSIRSRSKSRSCCWPGTAASNRTSPCAPSWNDADGDRHRANHVRPVGGHRQRFLGRRRHRHHEYHAGQCDRRTREIGIRMAMAGGPVQRRRSTSTGRCSATTSTPARYPGTCLAPSWARPSSRFLLHLGDGIAERGVALEVERDRDGRELALVVDRDRLNGDGRLVDERGQRHHRPGRRPDVQLVQRRGLAELARQHLEHV